LSGSESFYFPDFHAPNEALLASILNEFKFKGCLGQRENVLSQAGGALTIQTHNAIEAVKSTG
jgi:hypothetical protein